MGKHSGVPLSPPGGVAMFRYAAQCVTAGVSQPRARSLGGKLRGGATARRRDGRAGDGGGGGWGELFRRGEAADLPGQGPP